MIQFDKIFSIEEHESDGCIIRFFNTESFLEVAEDINEIAKMIDEDESRPH